MDALVGVRALACMSIVLGHSMFALGFAWPERHLDWCALNMLLSVTPSCCSYFLFLLDHTFACVHVSAPMRLAIMFEAQLMPQVCSAGCTPLDAGAGESVGACHGHLPHPLWLPGSALPRRRIGLRPAAAPDALAWISSEHPQDWGQHAKPP